jgi:AraC-like DNA-binding protein
METRIVGVNDSNLSQYIQSFLFFKSQSSQPIKYTTFPNINLCLAIYGQNHVSYIHNDTQNICNINYGSSLYQSRLYGFHENPFEVNLKSSLDQVCILFHPGALRAFTNLPFEELLKSSNAFDIIFKGSNNLFFEEIFNEDNELKRATILKRFLKSKLLPGALSAYATEALNLMKSSSNQNLRIEEVARRFAMDPATLYRLFLTSVGQSPKMFQKTVRFRTALNYMMDISRESLTDVAYLSQYYDQAHFIKDIKSLTGFAPKQLRKKLVIEQQQLTWVYEN